MASARILAVDDSPTILEMIKTILEAADYEVITAADGAEALETARQADRAGKVVVTFPS